MVWLVWPLVPHLPDTPFDDIALLRLPPPPSVCLPIFREVVHLIVTNTNYGLASHTSGP